MKPTKENRNEEFIIAHADVIDWRYLSINIDITQFSDEFFIRFEREIKWYVISYHNKSITTEFAHKHQKKIGSKRWYKDGKLHREDGPAEIRPNGTKHWFLNGERHRIDGPAIIRFDGSEAWFLSGERHRIDGPAVTSANGQKEWWVNGERHREDGPAIIWPDGSEQFWLNGRNTSKHNNKLTKQICKIFMKIK